MKQLLHGLFVAAAIVCCSFLQVFAQQLPPVPVDPNVRIGKLDNGLTYYIRKNALPANRADFYIPLPRRCPETVSRTYRREIRRKPECLYFS